MTVYHIDPLTDPRWESLLLQNPRASVFHTRGWLQALQRTYGYRPIAFTTSGPGDPVKNALVFCEVKSWITGRRLVSLPFSDHCDPLVDSVADGAEIVAHVRQRAEQEGCRYVEIRPLAVESGLGWKLQPGKVFHFHALCLDSPAEVLFRQLHKDCIQRKVQRAEREKIEYEKGRSEGLLRAFYELMRLTRRRQGLPPQPFHWFRNLAECMGDSLTVRVALKDQHPVAAILTLGFKDKLVYKYGCSDERFNQLGATPFLFWQTIQEARDQGMKELDLGRSDLDNEGLAKFKDRLGAVRTMMHYWRYPGPSDSLAAGPSWMTLAAKRILPRLPSALLSATGRILYRHVG